MNVLRSLLFNIQFYLGTSILVTICLPCLLFPRPVVLFVNRIWCLIMIKGMKWWLNTDINLIGEIPKKKQSSHIRDKTSISLGNSFLY